MTLIQTDVGRTKQARQKRKLPGGVDDAQFRTELGKLVIGDCIDVLRGLPANSVDLVITSPPYDGQSKYGNGEKYELD